LYKEKGCFRKRRFLVTGVRHGRLEIHSLHAPGNHPFFTIIQICGFRRPGFFIKKSMFNHYFQKRGLKLLKKITLRSDLLNIAML
jgi:hypothetical protein